MTAIRLLDDLDSINSRASCAVGMSPTKSRCIRLRNAASDEMSESFPGDRALISLSICFCAGGEAQVTTQRQK